MAHLSRSELIGLVIRVTNPTSEDTDESLQAIMRQIEAAVPDPNVSGYIFWDDSGMGPEEIVDKALAYKPFAL